jgi:hypothetical protein
MLRRTLIVLWVTALMIAMFVAVPAAPANPPSGGGGTGCAAGQLNAYLAIGFADPSGEQRAPYRDNPGILNGGGNGPIHGFDTSEPNVQDVETTNCRS